MPPASSPKHRYESLSQGEPTTSDDPEEAARDFPRCPQAAVEWPETNASVPTPANISMTVLSKLFFWWFNPMIKLGNRTHVQVGDLWALSERDSSAINVERFRPMWRAECEAARLASRPPNILRPIIKFVLPMVVQVAVLQLCSVGFQFLRPVILQQILMLVEGNPAALVPVEKGWTLAVALFVTTVADFMCVQHLSWLQFKQQVRVRAAVIGLLYEQTVRLSDGTKQSYSSGKITNMMDTDQSTLQTYTTQMNRLWQVPLTFILALSMILKLLGWAGALGVICMLPMTLATRWNVMQLRTWKKRRVIKQDARLKTLTEVMQGIRIIKFMNWEESFKERIDIVRTDEIHATKMAAIVRSMYSAFADFQPILIMIVSLGTFSVVFGHTLTASIAFPTLNFLNILRNPLVQFPDALNWVLVEGKIAGDRISTFLSEGQTVEYRELRPAGPSVRLGNDRETAVEIVGGTFRFDEPPSSILWAPEDVGAKFGSRDNLKQIQKRRDEIYTARQARASSRPPPVLQNINLSIGKGDLVCLIGRVGAGKTALLHSILGELVKIEGRVTISGSLSYAAQSAFILNSTVKENILFGSPYNEQRYCDVVRGCALAEDLKTLPEGDGTEIGERGVNLSGGQRQRLGLARALYRLADTYLLDDPLSAVDAHVGAHIMNFILEFVRRERRTIIMPCHQLHFLRHADLIVTLADSTICEVGTFDTLMAAGNEFSNLMEKHSAADSPATTPRGDSGPDEEAAEVDLVDISDAELLVTLKGAGKSGSLISLEDRKTGKVARKTYVFFGRQFACRQLLPLALLFLTAQLVRFGMDYWMSRWAIDDHDVLPVANPSNTTQWFVAGYAILGVCTFLFSGVRYLWLQMIGLGASRKMHNLMLSNLLHAPCAFFDTTPVGRIVNRFSGDVNCLDFTVPVYFHSVAMLALQLLTSLGVVSVMLPGFVLWVVPMAWANNWLTTKYRNCAREVKRLSSNLRSPLFQHFNESINGLTTVRAFAALPAFTVKSGQTVDDWSRAQMCQQSSPRWLGIRISSLSSISIFITSFGVLWWPNRLDSGLVGVVLTYTEMVSSSLQSFLQNMTELEIQMNSVERVRFFSEQVSQEAPYVRDKVEQAAGRGGVSPWPSAGVVRFQNVSARYRPELPRVLHGLSIDVGTAQKVGVCGRTGSGKSTLMLLLFRILELDEGSIEIDGVDISTLGLSQLRRAIAMLPQDPILFAGTIKENLDPFGQHDDSQLYAALEQAQLMRTFKRQNQDLESNVGEGGGTLSVGQRQLLCFARAVLRNSKLLVMDECTANVDVETDSLLQSMVRQTFAKCTIFTIAHRLATVIDYDRIAVLDNGHLVEYGQPAQLLGDPAGQLTALVEQTGPTMSSHLRSAAAAAAIATTNKAGR